MEYILTDQGRKNINEFIEECKAYRKEILDAGKDTCEETELPTMDDIVNDLSYGVGVDFEGDYVNGWGVTDCYSKGIMLESGIDFVENAYDL